MDVNELQIALAATPAPDSQAYQDAIIAIQARLSNPRSELEAILRDSSADTRARFAAFFGILTALWRDRDFTKYARVFEEFEFQVGDHPLLPFLRAEYLMSRGTTRANLESALANARQAVEGAPRFPGILHLFAEVTAELEELRDEPNEDRIREAERHLERAITLTHGQRAKYYATYARLCALRRAYEEAQTHLHEAIAREASDGSHYMMRVADYQLLRTRIEFSRQNAVMTERQQASLASLDSLRGQVIELVGLLAAVVAFLVSGIQISTSFPPADAARLFVVIAGAILAVFAGFSVLFFPARDTRRPLVVFAIGLVLMSTWVVLT